MRLLRAASGIEYFNFGRSHLSLQAMWRFRPGSVPTRKVSASIDRETEEKKTMARRKLTLEQQLSGVKAAIRSKRTPPQLREGLRRRAKWLSTQIGKGQQRTHKKNASFLLVGQRGGRG